MYFNRVSFVIRSPPWVNLLQMWNKQTKNNKNKSIDYYTWRKSPYSIMTDLKTLGFKLCILDLCSEHCPLLHNSGIIISEFIYAQSWNHNFYQSESKGKGCSFQVMILKSIEHEEPNNNFISCFCNYSYKHYKPIIFYPTADSRNYFDLLAPIQFACNEKRN